MMRSLSSAVAGLRSHQTKMDTIGNNIANVNTYGFKSSRVTFSDVYYQNLSSGSAPVVGGQGGTNPTQIGYGASVATIDILNSQAGSASTDRPMDVYITGDGFIPTQDANGKIFYSRLGILGLDPSGNVVDSTGNYVMGISKGTDGQLLVNDDGSIDPSNLGRITIDPSVLDVLTGIGIGASGEIFGVFPADTKLTIGGGMPEWAKDAKIPEGVKSNYAGSVTLFSRLEGNLDLDKWLKSVSFNDSADLPDGNYSFVYDDTDPADLSVKLTITPTDGSAARVYTGKFSANSAITLVDADNKPGATVTLGDTPTSDFTVVADMSTVLGISTSTEGGNAKEVKTQGAISRETAESRTIAIGDITITIPDLTKIKHGSSVIGTAEPGDSKTEVYGNLALAKFRNADGMEQAGNSKFVVSGNSGEATYVRPGTNGTGGVKSNYLEMSNVDISKEFTDMITTQRGFQANTRIITVSDEMLQELVNLKR